MARPTDDLDGHLTGLDTWAGLAAFLPDVPPERLVLLRAIRDWTSALKRRPCLPRELSPEAAGIEREIRALYQVIEADRRVPPRVGDHKWSTTACGAGPVPGPDWPHW